MEGQLMSALVFRRVTKKSLSYRFWSKVQKTDGCWLWTGKLDDDGYGHIRVRGKKVGAYRYSYELHRGEIPPGFCVCHRCDVNCAPGDTSYRRCVNPDHLFLGTSAENIADAQAKGRMATGDRNASRKHIERRPRGELHHWQMRPETRLTGEKNGRAKMTLEKANELRHLWGTGTYSKCELGRIFGISDTQVGKIISGLLWNQQPE